MRWACNPKSYSWWFYCLLVSFSILVYDRSACYVLYFIQGWMLKGILNSVTLISVKIKSHSSWLSIIDKLFCDWEKPNGLRHPWTASECIRIFFQQHDTVKLLCSRKTFEWRKSEQIKLEASEWMSQWNWKSKWRSVSRECYVPLRSMFLFILMVFSGDIPLHWPTRHLKFEAGILFLLY